MTYPVGDRKAAAALGAGLRRVGFSEEALVDMLGEDALGAEPHELAVYERRLARTRLGAVVRALFLQLPVARAELQDALGARAVDALHAIGFADAGETMRSRARILPVGDVFVASDDHAPDNREAPRDYVAAYTPTSRLCDSLTPRLKGVRALDVGTGSGVQAILAARHAKHVVATDVNERALAFTDLNAALNGLTNVETRRGSFFEAAEDERFDLITCNAPYVVSPENRWAFRDSGMRGDDVTRRVVTSAARHLTVGGYATVIGSWLGENEGTADERPFEWSKTLPQCDTWILSVWESGPLDHAASWNSEVKPAKLGAALDAWTGYLDELGAGWVSEGAILIHRRAGGRYSARVDGIDDDALEDAGEQVRRAFEGRAWLVAHDLLDARPKLAMPVELQRELTPRGRTSAFVQLVGGTSSNLDTTPDALDVVAKLDGKRTLRSVLRGAPPAAARLCRELIELGAVRV